MTEDITRAVQKQGLDILSKIDEVCTRHEIPYYLFYGTELGAVRHQGFIPWDDDIDIILYRKDFDRLKSVWQEEKPEGYFYQDYATDSNYRLKITKIRKDHTALVETAFKDVDMHHGVWVDLFVLDDYVKNGFLRKISQLIFMFDSNAVRNHKDTGIRGVLYSVTNRIFKNGKIFQWWFEKIFPKLKKDETMCCDLTNFTFSFDGEFKREWFGKGKRVPFEGKLFPIPENSHETLRVSYGDYQKLPPEEQRISQHNPYYYSTRNDYHPGMDIGGSE